MTTSSKLIILLLKILAWIIFIGLCVEAGTVIVSIFYAWLSPEKIAILWKPIDLAALHRFDSGYYFVQVLLISIVAVLKAVMFYLIIKILTNKSLQLSQPFNIIIQRFIISISWLALGIGLFSAWAVKTAEWLAQKGVAMPSTDNMNIEGADVWLFMTVILFVIVQVFKKGIEIQTENELTV